MQHYRRSVKSEGARSLIRKVPLWEKGLSCVLSIVLVVGLAPQFAPLSFADDGADEVLNASDVPAEAPPKQDSKPAEEPTAPAENDSGHEEASSQPAEDQAPDESSGDSEGADVAQGEESEQVESEAVEGTGSDDEPDSEDVAGKPGKRAKGKSSKAPAKAPEAEEDNGVDNVAGKLKVTVEWSGDPSDPVTVSGKNYYKEQIATVKVELTGDAKINKKVLNDVLTLNVVGGKAGTWSGDDSNAGQKYSKTVTFNKEADDCKLEIKLGDKKAGLDDDASAWELDSTYDSTTEATPGEFAIDATAPTDVKAIPKGKTESKDGVYEFDKVDDITAIELSATDKQTPIAKFKVGKGGSETEITASENSATYTPILSADDFAANDLCTIEVTAVDECGNESNATTITLKVDVTSPKLTVEYIANVNPVKGGNSILSKNGNDGVKAILTIEEPHFGKDKLAVSAKGGAVDPWTDNKDGTWSCSVSYQDGDDCTLQVSGTDAFNNKLEYAGEGPTHGTFDDGEYNWTFDVDTTGPQITVEWNSDAEPINDTEPINDKYFSTDRTATITIEDSHFDEAKINVTGGNAGENLKWVDNGPEHTATVKFTENASAQKLTIKGTDAVGNAVQGTDAKGNAADYYDSGDFVIDLTNPIISIAWDNTAVKNGMYYAKERIATVTVTEVNFNKDDFAIKDGSTKINTTWKSNNQTHTCEIEFDDSGGKEQQLVITGTDRAGRPIVVAEGQTPDNGMPDASQLGTLEDGTYKSATFIVDTKPPKVTIAASQVRTGTGDSQHKVDYFSSAKTLDMKVSVEDDNFAPANNKEKDFVTKIDVTGKQSDAAYNEKSWTTDGKYTLTFGEHDSSNPSSTMTVTATDLAGNSTTYTYGSSEGGSTKDPKQNLTENSAFALDITAPQVVPNSGADIPTKGYSGKYGNGSRALLFYKSNTRLQMRLTDALGVMKVEGSDGGRYSVSTDEKKAGSRSYTVNIDLVNGKEFTNEFKLTATDFAGNWRRWSINPKTGTVTDVSNSNKLNTPLYATQASLYPLKLIEDTTSPVVRLSGVAAGKYYNSNQTARLDVEELNFKYLAQHDAGQVVLTVSKQEGNGGRAQSTRTVSAGQMSAVNAAAGSYMHNEPFNQDGHYTLYAYVTDPAGNQGEARIEEFTVDKTPPTVQVTWDNNNARNGMYYNAPRTATVVVTEHNFDPASFRIETTGSVGGWSSSGDTHTAVVSFGSDGRYAMTVSGQDKAGNALATYTEPEFVIDMTKPSIHFEEVDEENAYNGTIQPVIVYEDEANFDSAGMQYKLTGAKHGERDFVQSTTSAGNSGTVAFVNFPEEVESDDIYTLEATLVDMAGNDAEASIVFSVNRFGSNFVVVDAADYAEGNGYLPMAQEVVVQEINVTGSEAEKHGVSITQGLQTKDLPLQSRPNTDEEGYYIVANHDSAGWAEYEYHVVTRNFMSEDAEGNPVIGEDGNPVWEDGSYHIVVNSTDRAENKNNSSNYYDPEKHDVADAEVSFILDTTAPLIEGLSIDNGGLYDAASHQVTFSVTDNIGFDSVMVAIDGETTAVEPDASGLCAVDVQPESFTGRDMTITASDLAGHKTVQQVSGFRMTTNFFELYMFPILAALAIAAGGGVGAFVALRRRRNQVVAGGMASI